MPGVYISYPFCAQKCTYCNFASGVFPRELELQYVEALKTEIAAHEFQWIPETLYLGGGTPSQLASLQPLLVKLPHEWKEATLEAAPGTVTTERVRNWRECGINRISLGVQSFVQTEIARTGRKHTAQIVEGELKLLREHELTNVNLDLIAGLAGQTRESWRESLDWIERLAPPHVSVYILEVDEDSRLGQELMLGGVRYGAGDVPGEALTVELYETAVERLKQMGEEPWRITVSGDPALDLLKQMTFMERASLSDQLGLELPCR